MSLTSTVDPYVDEQAETVAPAVEPVDAEEARRREVERERFEAEIERSLEQAAESRRERAARQALASHGRLTSKKLHVARPEELVRAASALGYRVERSGVHGALLRAENGTVLGLSRDRHGRLELRSSAGPRPLQELVREHTRTATVGHLKALGYSLREARLSSGEVQLVAQAPQGPAQLSVQVNADGTTWVDVAGVSGSGCGDVVAGLARAVGGQVTDRKPKDDWFRLPAGAPKARVRG
jgi:hypothetical protein